MFKIEKNVKLPVRSARFRKSYPFKDMQKGDSFWVPLADEHPAVLSNKLRAAAYAAFGKGNYSCARDGEGYRVWRIA